MRNKHELFLFYVFAVELQEQAVWKLQTVNVTAVALRVHAFTRSCRNSGDLPAAGLPDLPWLGTVGLAWGG